MGLVAACRRSARQSGQPLNNTSQQPLQIHHLITEAPFAKAVLNLLSAVMALKLPRALALAALALSCVTSASNNYSSVDMMRAQLTLMEDRPKDCPPWYGAQPLIS